jgi:hypothetical protein
MEYISTNESVIVIQSLPDYGWKEKPEIKGMSMKQKLK